MNHHSIRDAILTAAQAATLAHPHRIFTRGELAVLTGLSGSIIHDYFKRLVPSGEIVCINRGVYTVPGLQRRDEPVNVTVLNDGCHKIERGDDMLVFSEDEACMLKMGCGNARVKAKGKRSELDGDVVSVTVQVTGMVLLEKGAASIELSPGEFRALKLAMG